MKSPALPGSTVCFDMPITVQIRFYEELNDFLKPEQRKKPQFKKLDHKSTVKDIIQSYGIPHTEVDLILINSQSTGFDHQVRDGDRISVYPVFESLDISGLTRLQQKPLRQLCFVADVHLGKLARNMRLLGLDVNYSNTYTKADLLEQVTLQQRILLTGDRQLLMHNIVQRGYLVRSSDPDQQIKELVQRFDLGQQLKPFTRCLHCNGLLDPVAKTAILDQLEVKTRQYYEDFVQCRGCRNIYWKGSHYTKMKTFIRQIIDSELAADEKTNSRLI